ncbi:MAG: hypothetical protein IKK66_04280 [Ruminococcus sp.]|nr:hypothetical protein [Ruminococcus sp.]
MLNLKNKILSYRQYYKICVIYSIINAFLWAFWGIAELFIMKDNKSLLFTIITYALLLLSFFIVTEIFAVASAMRDKEDELYKENVAKTNSSFLWFLLFTGFAVFIAVNVIRNISDTNTITLTFHEGFIGSLIYFLYAVYNGIVLHYENCTAEEDNDA